MSTTYTPGLGDHISTACQKATALATHLGENVPFTFNDIKLLATPTGLASDLEAEWERVSNERHAVYLASSEYARNEAARKANIAENQSKADALVGLLPDVDNLDGLLHWLSEFIPAVDWIGVIWPREGVLKLLQEAGYESRQFTGLPPEWFTTRERAGRWIVGQVMVALETNHPIWPRLASMAEEALALPTMPDTRAADYEEAAARG